MSLDTRSAQKFKSNTYNKELIKLRKTEEIISGVKFNKFGQVKLKSINLNNKLIFYPFRSADGTGDFRYTPLSKDRRGSTLRSHRQIAHAPYVRRNRSPVSAVSSISTVRTSGNRRPAKRSQYAASSQGDKHRRYGAFGPFGTFGTFGRKRRVTKKKFIIIKNATLKAQQKKR